MDLKPRLAIIGAGYVGLVASACFAELGFKVICVEKNEQKFKKLKKRESPIYEPLLAQLIEKNLANERLMFSDSLNEVILLSDVIFITVDTPITEDMRVDVSNVEHIIRSIAPLLNCYKVIVVKSTAGVGLTRRLANMIDEINSAAQFDMVSNPEFLRAGSAIKDFMDPDRIILGIENERASKIMTQLYQPFIDKNIPIIYTNLEEAELIKYAANCFLAMKVGFANEMAHLCENLGVEIKNVLHGMGLDKRIGNNYLQPGPGIGGSCLSKDALALSFMAKMQGAPLSIMEAVLKSNSQHKHRMIEKIIAACNGSVANKRLAILGIAFKANTDDIRESPTLSMITQLQCFGAILQLYDPVVKQIPPYENISFGATIDDTINDADAVIIMTEWEEFRELSLTKIKNALRNDTIPPTLIDLRNLFTPKLALAAGLRYFYLGSNDLKISR